jgi:hypothetical protein
MAWSRRQFAGSASTGPVTSDTVTLGSPSGAGNLIIVGVAFYNSAANTASVADDKGNVYTQVGGYATAIAGRLAIFVCKSILASASPQITATISGASYTDVCAIEYSGCDGATQPDGSSGANGAGTAADSGSVSVAAAHELLVSFTSQSTNSTATITPGGGATSVYDAHTAAMPLAASELDVSAATDGQFTYSSTVAWMCVACSLKIAAGASFNPAVGAANNIGTGYQ